MRFGYIQLIRRCNQRCRFCSNPDNDAELPLAEAERLIDDFAARGWAGVQLSGGEPTLHPQLPAVIRYAEARGLPARVITNGQRTADRAYLEELVAAGLAHVHVSLQSHRADVQAALTGQPDSLAHLTATLHHLGDLGVTADVNTTLNSANAGHLDQTVEWLVDSFPWLHHWVWNNLDPTANRATANPDVIAAPRDFELSLQRAMRLLDLSGRTFRVERVPLCFMAEYAHCSTETRKLVTDGYRDIAFLDDRGRVSDRDLWRRYAKAPVCGVCRLTPICAGLFATDVHDFRDQLFPVFLSQDAVVRRIRERLS